MPSDLSTVSIAVVANIDGFGKVVGQTNLK